MDIILRVMMDRSSMQENRHAYKEIANVLPIKNESNRGEDQIESYVHQA